jgi:hypothetical protein
MMKVPSQTLASPGAYRGKTIAPQTRLLIIIFRIHGLCRAFFARLLIALAETRRQEAKHILRQYRHLIDPAND